MVLNIYSANGVYKLDLVRSVTVLQGDSGTGKSYMVNLVSQYTRDGKASGIRIECERKVVSALEIDDNETYFSKRQGYVVILDEDVLLSDTRHLQEVARRNDCWLVFITRRSKLGFISTSVKSVLRLVRNGKMFTTVPAYNFDMPHRYDFGLVTEDSSTGNEFINLVAPADKLGGKDKLSTRGNNLYYHTYFMDGAAFSAQMASYYEAYRDGRLDFILPECFEEVLLHSPIFSNNGYVKCVLDDPENNGANNVGMFTWETFYEEVIGKVLPTVTNEEYSKSVLSKCFISHCCPKRDSCSGITDVRDKVHNTLLRSGLSFLYGYNFLVINGYKFDLVELKKKVPEMYHSNLKEFIEDNFEIWKQYGEEL